MSLKRLTTREMVQLGTDLIDPNGDSREVMDRYPAGAGMVPVIERANTALVAAQPPSGSEIEALTDAITALDVRHDDLIRSIDGRLESEYYATTNEETRQKVSSTRRATLPTGRAIIQASHLEEAGEVIMRAGRVDADDRALLGELTTLEGATMEQLLDELQQVGTELGQLEKKRDALGEEGQLVIKHGQARYQWIRAINALEGVLLSEGVDPTTVLKAIYEAEARAERRGAGGTDTTETDTTRTTVKGTNATGTDADDTGTDDSETDDTGTDDTETELTGGPPADLDPPVPNDDDDPTNA